MIDARLEQELNDDRDPREKLTVMLQWQVEHDSSLFEGAQSGRDRRERLGQLYERLKGGVLADLASCEVDVKNFTNSPNVAVTGTRDEIRRIVDGRLRETEAVAVRLNQIAATTREK